MDSERVNVIDWYVQIAADRVAQYRKVGNLPVELVADDAPVKILPPSRATEPRPVAAERARCAKIARDAMKDWKAYPEGSICEEIEARIYGY